MLLKNTETVENGAYVDPIPDAWELEFIDVGQVGSECAWLATARLSVTPADVECNMSCEMNTTTATMARQTPADPVATDIVAVVVVCCWVLVDEELMHIVARDKGCVPFREYI